MFVTRLLRATSKRTLTIRTKSTFTSHLRTSSLLQTQRPTIAAFKTNNNLFQSFIPSPLLTTTFKFNPSSSNNVSLLQTMHFSTSNDERRRQRAERRRRRQGSRTVLEKERESVTGEPVDDAQQATSGRRQIDAMSEGQGAYIRNVWGLVGANLGVSSVGTITAMTVLPVSPLIPAIASLGLLLGLTMGAPKGSNPVLRAGLLGGFAFTTGMTLGPLVGAAMQMDPLLVPMALAASSGIFVGATAFSMFAPEGKLLSWGGPLFGGVLVMIGCQVFNIFMGPYPVLNNVMLYGGLGIFTVFVAYDTQQILDDYKNGKYLKRRSGTRMEHCSYRHSDFYDLILFLLSSLKS